MKGTREAERLKLKPYKTKRAFKERVGVLRQGSTLEKFTGKKKICWGPGDSTRKRGPRGPLPEDGKDGWGIKINISQVRSDIKNSEARSQISLEESPKVKFGYAEK